MGQSRRHRQKESLAARYRQADDQEITERWKALRPRLGRYFLIFSGVAVVLFGCNRVLHPSQVVTNVINVAFQIASAFSVCLMMLLLSAMYFARQSTKG